MKKRLIVCMSVSILMSMIFSSSIYAYDDYNQLSIQLDQPVLYQEKRDDLVVMNNNELSEDEALFLIEERLKEAILNGKNDVDLCDLKLDLKEYEWVAYMKSFSPYISNGISLSIYIDSYTNTYSRIIVDNKMSIDETKEYFDRVSQKINEIKSILSKDYSDEMNALLLHDYFVYHYEYDVDAFNNGSSIGFEDSFRSGGLIMNGVGVCQGYSFAYKYFLNLMGIECLLNTSESMRHMWNVVNIDGEYYHVDTTYDDPIPDKKGKVLHDRFLNSDAKMISLGYKQWSLSDVECKSQLYDFYSIKYAKSQVIIDNNNYYYITDYGFVRSDKEGNSYVINDLGDWMALGQYLAAKYSGLIKAGNYLYYNDSHSIYRYDLKNQKQLQIYKPQINDQSIMGMIEKDEKVYMIINDSLVLTPISLLMKNEYIYLKDKDIHMNINEEVILDVVVASGGDVTYTSSDESIATVKDGVVTALKAGTTTITISVNGLKESCKVTVQDEQIVEKPFPFTDVSNKQWYYGVISEAYQLGLMTGASDSLFKPNANMNRGMVAIVFHRMEGSKKVEYSSIFPDVAKNQYYTTSVLWAKQTGVINGYKDGTFKPLRNVTREEMATMIYNFARYKGLDMSASKDITYFSDYAKITPYARVTLQWAVEKGLMSGKDNGTRLDPLGTATRAECSKMLVQAYKVIYVR